ncbi:MAG: SHOCT domain-containing protein [Gammaproteobacteria bacterium]|nr:SHOCT domain-containing protein [Gammaproteobacteria bacterium]
MTMFHDMGNWGWGMGFGWFFMILFWALVILGIVAIVKWLAGSSGAGGAPPSKTARQILEERYARGEIEREEFEQKKRDLEH